MTSLAKSLGYNTSYLSQLAGPNPSRNINEKTARKIESTLRLAVGWMDEPRGPLETTNAGVTPGDCLIALDAALMAAKSRPAPAKYATLIDMIYERALRTGTIDTDYVRQLVALIR